VVLSEEEGEVSRTMTTPLFIRPSRRSPHLHHRGGIAARGVVTRRVMMMMMVVGRGRIRLRWRRLVHICFLEFL